MIEKALLLSKSYINLKPEQSETVIVLKTNNMLAQKREFSVQESLSKVRNVFQVAASNFLRGYLEFFRERPENLLSVVSEYVDIFVLLTGSRE